MKQVLDAARKASEFDYLAFKTLVLLGVSPASLVGQSDRRPGMFPNPGMLIENMTPDGIYIYEKHRTEKVFKPIPRDLRTEINWIIGKRTKGKIFPRTRAWLWERLGHYAKIAGVTQKVDGNELNKFSETYRPFLPTVLENPDFFEKPQKEPETAPRKFRQEPIVQAQNPRETLESAFVTIRGSLSEEILARLRKCSPKQFEERVLELLVKMGYGSWETAQVIGRSGDEGIDGVIKLDKLGLGLLGFQAKRWNSPVGSAEIRNFVGSLDGLRAREGIFFSTSRFSKDAWEWSKKTEKKIILIDGEQLAALMIDHDVGVDVEKTLVIKKINDDFFK